LSCFKGIVVNDCGPQDLKKMHFELAERSRDLLGRAGRKSWAKKFNVPLYRWDWATGVLVLSAG